jgi:TetR/AcrR family transcriptional regulator, cholesterol catabolism regulator
VKSAVPPNRIRGSGSSEHEVPQAGRRNGSFPKELIDAAAQTFAESGYLATPLTEVAERFGILKGSLYHYIDTKEDLLFAIVHFGHEYMRAHNVRWRDEADPLEAIGLFVEDHVRAALDGITYTIVWTHEFRRLSPERLRLIARRRSVYERGLRNLIAAGIQQGEVRPDIDPKLATLAIFGLMNWVYTWYGTDKRFKTDEVVAQLRRQALAMLVPTVPVGSTG